MALFRNIIWIFVIVSKITFIYTARLKHVNGAKDNEQWGYVTVRENAHIFWWLYNYPAASNKDVPLILWLQGGPGGSGTGFGNFGEIGPLDVKLKPRPTTWLKRASLLFVDNPVGTGFSYVDDPSAYTITVDQIAEDLVELFKQVYRQIPRLQDAPLYIFSESYGGKMAAVFAVHLWNAIQRGEIIAKFRGVAFGDSWIHPEIIVHSWGDYLYSTSLVDQYELSEIEQAAQNISQAIANGDWRTATELWDSCETVVEEVTDGVDWYNILNPLTSHSKRLLASRKLTRNSQKISSPAVRRLYERRMHLQQNDQLDDLMNGPIRKKLAIIPNNVTWGGQSADVFSYQSTEFMKPVTKAVDYLLKNTTLKVVVYNGQLDLICDSIGVEGWVQTLKWPGLPGFNMANREAVTLPDQQDFVVGYVKTYETFSFYWMLRGGHMLPADQGKASLRMIDLIMANNK